MLSERMDDLIVKTMISCQPELTHYYRTCQPSDLEGNMWFEVLGFDIYIDRKAKPWLIEVNLAPSFATDSNLDDELKRGVITDAFRLLGMSHKERIRKINKKKEDMQKRIVERTSYKESLLKKKEELERQRKKREAFEHKNIGGYKLAYPSQNEEKQALYEEYLKASIWTLPFPTIKALSSVANGPKKSKSTNDDKNNFAMPKLKNKSQSGTTQDKIARAKEVAKKNGKSPYEVGIRRLITPASQKRTKQDNISKGKNK